MANSTASVTSLAQKPGTTSSTSSNIPLLNRKKSCDTLCSSNTSCYVQKRKPHPLAASIRYTNRGNPKNAVNQRVLSAKLIKLRSVQSQLNDANFHLAELAKENQALRNLQRRQDKALKNYEGADAELPRLIKKHEEELRVVQDKNKNLKKALREVIDQLKAKDDELNNVRSQLKHLTSLTKDKHLGEREKLKRELEESKLKINDYEKEISMLNRRLMLESKNAKYKLNKEVAKHKQCQKDLTQVMEELNKNGHYVPELNNEMKQTIANRKKILTQRPSITSIRLKAESTPDLIADPSTVDLESTTDLLKLDPIDNKIEDISGPRSILKSPAESVKNRLTSGRSNNELPTSLMNLSLDGEKVAIKNNFLKTNPLHRTLSNHKIDLLSETVENNLKKTTAEREPEETELGNYCLNVMKSVKTMNTMVERHTFDYEACSEDTTKILEKLKEVDLADSIIRKKKIEVNDESKAAEKDLELVNKIWGDEYNFQKTNKNTDKNGNLKEVNYEEKKKLLATLRAIDNGELDDNIGGDLKHKSKKDIMTELFGRGCQ
ncbi:lebercilin-like protein [Onthophagus taurus]|uniref:lebercilin-like protein n=1 Tax=Onthophagus taurus TaxID=166361 RepID=UPI000C203DD9|nr:myosin heavy chain, non-muscle [Onthophagus taurus]